MLQSKFVSAESPAPPAFKLQIQRDDGAEVFQPVAHHTSCPSFPHQKEESALQRMGYRKWATKKRVSYTHTRSLSTDERQKYWQSTLALALGDSSLATSTNRNKLMDRETSRLESTDEQSAGSEALAHTEVALPASKSCDLARTKKPSRESEASSSQNNGPVVGKGQPQVSGVSSPVSKSKRTLVSIPDSQICQSEEERYRRRMEERRVRAELRKWRREEQLATHCVVEFRCFNAPTKYGDSLEVRELILWN